MFQIYFMKSILVSFLLLIAVAASAQTAATKTDPLVLKQTEHDFGKIPQGKPVYFSFDLSNVGNESLTLENVQASCGCTTPEWSKEPIAPGASAQIRVGYNAASEGLFQKDITITYRNGETKRIQIKGQVWRGPEGSAPSNTSVEFLKKQTL